MKIKNIIKILVLSYIIGTSSVKIFAQDQEHFTMYYIQPSVINPAAMGMFENANGALFFNKQLAGFANSPLYLNLDVNVPIGKTGLIIGLNGVHDRVNVVDKTKIGLSFAYRIKLNLKNYLTFGLTGSTFVQNGLFSNSQVLDGTDPVFLNNVTGVWSPDIKIGAHYFTDNFSVGYNVGNIFVNRFLTTGTGPQNDIQVDATQMHHYLQTAFQFKLSPDWKLRPSALFKFIPGAPLQIDINANVLFKESLGFGLSYRTLSTLAVNLNYTFNRSFVIGYAFNMGLGFENRTNFTGHEVLLAFRINKTKKLIPVEIPRF